MTTDMPKVLKTRSLCGSALKCHHSMEPLEQNFPVVLFIMLYKAVITFESVDEILKFDH